MAQIRITILADNQALPGLLSEHGFSLWIETIDTRILFDTGQGAALAANAPTLGVDLATADMLVLSHGHYDHTGGIPHILDAAGAIDVYCHPGVVQPRYSIRDGKPRPIHMPVESMAALDTLPGNRMHRISQSVQLSDAMGLTGPIPRETAYEDTGGPFYLDPDGMRSDPVADDLALWIRTEDGLVVCTGCCHAGIVNTLNHIRRLNDGIPVCAVIGGLHLTGADTRRLDATAAAMHSLHPDIIIPCHCTGEHAIRALQNAGGERIVPGAAGMTYRF